MTIYIIIFLILKNIQNSSVVCDEETLKQEILQDLEDNGNLDCLRFMPTPVNYEETIEQTNKRILAQWDSFCSFEADYDWMKDLKQNFQINHLVDVNGEIVDKNQDDQADLCEIFRTIIHLKKFNKKDHNEIINLINCPGSEETSKICAANSRSFYQNNTWTILLDTSAIQVEKRPQFYKSDSQYLTNKHQNIKNHKNQSHDFMINSNLYTHYIQEFIFKDEKFINESNFNYPQIFRQKSAFLLTSNYFNTSYLDQQSVNKIVSNKELDFKIKLNQNYIVDKKFENIEQLNNNEFKFLELDQGNMKYDFQLNSNFNLTQLQQQDYMCVQTIVFKDKLPFKFIKLSDQTVLNFTQDIPVSDVTSFYETDLKFDFNLTHYKENIVLILGYDFQQQLSNLNAQFSVQIKYKEKQKFINQHPKDGFSKIEINDSQNVNFKKLFYVQLEPNFYTIQLKYNVSQETIFDPDQGLFSLYGYQLPEKSQYITQMQNNPYNKPLNDHFEQFGQLQIQRKFQNDYNCIISYEIILNNSTNTIHSQIFVNNIAIKQSQSFSKLVNGNSIVKHMFFMKLHKGEQDIQLKIKNEQLIQFQILQQDNAQLDLIVF